MSFVDHLLQRLFPHKPSPHLPILEEPLQRSERQRQSYFRWLNEGRHKALRIELWEAWESKKRQEDARLQVHLLKQNGANGLALTYHHSIGPQPFQHLFDLLRDQVLQLGYHLYTSDYRLFDRGQYTERIEKHYLKPPIQLVVENDSVLPCDQRYGNVLIEYVQINDAPSFIRFMANYYEDRLYNKALPFDDLVREVLA